MLTSSRNIHGSLATTLIQAAICTATCSAVMSHASAPVAPMTSITVALVWKALTRSRGRSRTVMSR